MNQDNYCIIMAGGAGSRFWPISRTDKPKQFIDIMGIGKSMLQTTFERFEQICPRENIIVVTGEKYVEQVRQQIPDLLPYQVLSEPYRRNTAPCIAYAASIIHGLNPNANVVVSPSDHAIFGLEAYQHDICHALELTRHDNKIITIGVPPTCPSTKYGYIQFNEEGAAEHDTQVQKVVTFTEKPPLEIARQFLATGEFFWNAGIFVWNIRTLMQAFRTHLPNIAKTFFRITAASSADQLHTLYSLCESISVDVGIMEKADNVYVLRSSFGWSDVETWDLLYNTCPHDERENCFVQGNVFAYEVENTLVHVPADKKLILQGLDGYIVAGDQDMLLICRRDQEERLIKFASDVELAEILGK